MIRKLMGKENGKICGAFIVFTIAIYTLKLGLDTTLSYSYILFGKVINMKSKLNKMIFFQKFHIKRYHLRKGKFCPTKFK